MPESTQHATHEKSRAAAAPRENFIPLAKADLVRLLLSADDLSLPERDQLARLCRLLGLKLHGEYHERLEQLKSLYAPFDPDADTRHVGEPAAAAAADAQPQAVVFFDEFTALLERANFRRLTRQDLEQAIDAASDWGLSFQVDFSVFHQLEVFARGETVSHRKRRRWRHIGPRKEFDVPIYQRLAVVFRLRPQKQLGQHADPRAVYIKLFKNIPKMDIEMLLPGTRVRMSMFDQGRIWLPTVSGLTFTLWKILQGAAVFVFAGIKGIFAFLAFLIGTIGYGVRSFFGYLNTKNKYHLNMTRNLYYQNLDNNFGVLFRLLDEAEEQEFRETLLGYYVLWKHADPAGWTTDQIDAAAEELLAAWTGLDVDFEVADALAKLKHFRLVEPTGRDRWIAVPLERAMRDAG